MAEWLCLEYTYLPAPAPSPSPYVHTYISPPPSLCKWMSCFWSLTCLLFLILLAACSLFSQVQETGHVLSYLSILYAQTVSLFLCCACLPSE